MSKDPAPGPPPFLGSNPDPVMGDPTTCTGGDGCEGCCPPSSVGPMANSLDRENGRNASCPNGQPGFNNSPPNALDRAFALANLGLQQSQAAVGSFTFAGSGCGGSGEVNITNGNLIARWSLPGTGTMDPSPELIYNSQSDSSTEFGYGWTNLLRQRVSLVSAGITNVAVIKGSGKVWQYTNKDGSGNYQAPNDAPNALRTFQESGNDVWLETQPNGFQLKYDSTGKLAWMQNAQQARWTMTYSSDLLESITNPNGLLTTLAYDGTPLLESITDISGRITSFSYTGSDLTQVTTPELCQLDLTYDGGHNLTSIAAAGGQRISYSYDGSDRLQQITWPNGGISSYSYSSTEIVLTDPRGQVTTLVGVSSSPQTFRVLNPLGQTTTTFTLDSSRLNIVTDGRGNRTTYTYSAANSITPRLLQTVQLPRGGVFTYLYDGSNRINSVIDPNGNQSTIIWDATVTYQRNALIDSLGGRTSYSYNTAGQMTAIQDALGNLTSRTYDTLGNLREMIDPLGNVTTLGYNSANVLVTSKDPLGNVTTFVRDQMNRVLATEDPLGRRTTNTYNSNGQVLAVMDALGNLTTNVYDATSAQLLATQDALGRRSTFSYDLSGRRTEVQDALGNRTTTVYDNANRVLATVDPLGNRSSFSYDVDSNPIAAQDPLGNVTTMVYDAENNVQAVIDPFGNATTFSYDLFNLRTRVLDPLVNATTFSYDALLRQTSVQDALDHRTSTTYDAASRPVASTNALGYATTTMYDAASRRITLWDARGNRTTFGYDAASRTTLTVDAVGNRFTSTYDAANQLSTTLDGRGARITYSYDAVGRQTLRNRSDGVRITQTYDAVGNRLTLGDATGITSYTYDALDRTASKQNPAGLAITYSYDSRSLRATMQDPLGARFTYAYDAVGRISTVKNNDNRVTTFVYDRTRRKGLRHGNGALVTYTYDNASQMTNVNNMTSSGSSIAQFTYTFDAVGNRTSVVELDGSRVTWSYDAINQLTNEHRTGTDSTIDYNITHVYDPVGNRTQCQQLDLQIPQVGYDFAYDAANQVDYDTSAATYEYDGAGNLTAVNWLGIHGYQPVSYALTWDAENRLVGYYDPTIDITDSYQYDGDGRRVQRISGGTIHNFLWDGENIFWQAGSDWSLQFRYTLEPRLYGTLLSDKLPAPFVGERFFHYDGIGSTVRFTQGNGTAWTGTKHYQAFGFDMQADDQLIYLQMPFRWLGQYGYVTQYIQGAGYVPGYFDFANFYVRNRYFDRWAARWTGRDPLGLGSHANLYSYVLNAPLTRIDPSGLWLWLLGVALIGLGLGGGCSRKAAPPQQNAPPAAPPPQHPRCISAQGVPFQVPNPLAVSNASQPIPSIEWSHETISECYARALECAQVTRNMGLASAYGDVKDIARAICDYCQEQHIKLPPTKKVRAPAIVARAMWTACHEHLA